MYDLNAVYRKGWFAKRSKLAWRVPEICDAIIHVLSPHSLIDFGCGDGDLVGGFLERKVEAYGVEGTENCKEYIKFLSENLLICDLRKPVVFHKRVDLAISFEVAEHIEEEFAEIYLNNIVSVSDNVLITAAPPGQGGIKHVNCQPKEYWIAKMKQRDFNYNQEIVNKIRAKFVHKHKKGVLAYYNNLLFFKREL